MAREQVGWIHFHRRCWADHRSSQVLMTAAGYCCLPTHCCYCCCCRCQPEATKEALSRIIQQHPGDSLPRRYLVGRY